MNLRIVNIIKPKKPYYDSDDYCIREAVTAVGFYLLIDDIQKHDSSQNCYPKLMDTLLNAAAKSNYKIDFTIWGCYFSTYEGITFGIFITPRNGKNYAKVVTEIQTIAGIHDLTREMEMPDRADPLLTMKNPDTIIRYWREDFKIPDFYKQVTELPRDKYAYISKIQEKPEPYQILNVGDKKIKVENVIFKLAN